MSPTLPRHTRTASHASVASVRSLAPRDLGTLVIPLIVLLAIVVASAAQTEIAHHLTTQVGYHQPYFTFYLTHITFALVFPFHLGLLLVFRPTPLRHYLDALRWIIADQLGNSTASWRQVAPQWLTKVTWLTVLVSVPALSWFVAVNLTSGLAVTTIYATSSFWTYLFSMILLKQPLSRVTVGSIGLAFLGVLVLALDGMKGEASEGAPYPMLGDLVMTFGEWLGRCVAERIVPDPRCRHTRTIRGRVQDGAPRRTRRGQARNPRAGWLYNPADHGDLRADANGAHSARFQGGYPSNCCRPILTLDRFRPSVPCSGS